MSDAQIALAVAEVADNAPDRLVDLGRVLLENAGCPDALDISPRVVGHELLHIIGSHELST
jgi:hypothetical protein